MSYGDTGDYAPYRAGEDRKITLVITERVKGVPHPILPSYMEERGTSEEDKAGEK